MENIICNLLECTTTKDFLSTVNRYGECIDYSNDYERSKTKEAIFAGVVNKVYKMKPKGKGGNPEHDTLFILARCLINNQRESQPFRIGFFGNVVRQLADAKLQQGDAIAILKPKFFYASDVPTLNASFTSTVLWIGKNIKDSQTSVVSSSEVPDVTCIHGETDPIVSTKKRKIGINEDADSNSVASSSFTLSTIQGNVQILRSKPVELIPDSTTKSVSQNKRQKNSSENRIVHEIIENIVSQNTANAGSVDIPIRNDNCSNHFCNCNLVSKPQNHDEMHFSHHNCANLSCGNQNCHMLCNHKCCKLYEPNFSSCNCLTHLRHHMLQDCSCSSRIPDKLMPIQHCSHNISPNCCGNNVTHQHSFCNSAQSCHTGCCFVNRNCDRSHKISSCCPNAAHSRHHCQNPENRNTCSSHNPCQRQTCEKVNCNTLLHNCHQRRSLSHCCPGHKQTKCMVESRQSHCCSHVNGSNAPVQCSKQCNFNEKVDSCDELLSCKISRTKEWVHDWEQKLPSPQKLKSNTTDTTLRNPSCSSISAQTISRSCRHFDIEKRQQDAETIAPSVSSSSNISSLANSNKKLFQKKKKLFTPFDNSTVISEKSFCNHSTIVEESPPFSSESQKDNPPSGNEACEINIENYGPRHKHSHLSIQSLKKNSINPSTSRSMIQTEMKKNEATTNFGTSQDPIIDFIENISKKAVVNKERSGQGVKKNPSEELVLYRDHPHKNKDSGQNINKNLSEEAVLNKVQLVKNKDSGYEMNKNLYQVVLNMDLPDQDIYPGLENLSEEAIQNKDQPPDQTKHSGQEINKQLEEQFPVLQIATPIFSRATSIDDDERSYSDEFSVRRIAMHRKNIVSHKSANDETSINEKATNIKTKSGNDESNLELCPNVLVVPKTRDTVSVKNDICELRTANKSDKSNYSCLSLSLSNYSRSKINCHDDNVTAEMDLTDIPNNVTQELPMRRRPMKFVEDAADLMELTSESKLTKKRRTSPKKIPNPGSPKSDKNINSSTSVSSSGTFFDAVDTNSQIINNWCLQTIVDVFGREEYSVPAEDLVKLGLTHSDSYNFTLFSTFKIVGAIINIPQLSSDNYGGIIYGFCNEGCRKKFSYKDYCVTDVQKDYFCSFCKYHYHYTCPKCLKKGITQALCLAYCFEIHLVDGKNVLRIEVNHKEGINVIGNTPQHYLKSDKTFQKIKKIMISSLPEKWTNTVLLKAKVKVVSKSGVPTMTIQNTSFKNDLTLNRQHYKF